jgi:hypothetical protein
MSKKKGFNQDLGKQFVPFWNGLIHLVGKVENGTIIRRTDWENMIRECEDFEKNYMNSSAFCESCTFYTMPSFLQKKIDENPNVDCKMLAQDNDFLYSYCLEKRFPIKESKSNKKKYFLLSFFMMGMLLSMAFFFWWWQSRKKIVPMVNKTNDLSKQLYPNTSLLRSKTKPLSVGNL